MPVKARIAGALLACAVLSACNGGGGGSSAPSGGSAPTAGGPAPTGLQQCQAVSTVPATTTVPASPTNAPTSGTVQSSLILVPSGSHSLGVYLRNPWTGAVVDRGYVPTGQGASGVAVSASRFVYVANKTDGTVSAYAWDSTTDTLTSLGKAIASGPGTASLAVVGSTLYALNAGNDTISSFAIGSGGTLTLSGTTAPLAASVTSLVAGSGVLYGLASDGITSFSAGSAAPTALATTALSGVIAGTTNSAGNLFVLTSGNVIAFNAGASGALSQQDSVPLPSGLTASALSVGATQLNVVGQGSGNMELVTFPVISGGVACPTSAVLGSSGQPTGALVSPGGHTVYVTNATHDDLVAYTATTAGSGPTLLGSVRTRPTPHGLADLVATVGVSPQMLYVVDQGTNQILGYGVGANGALTGLTTTGNGGNGPSAGTISPDGETFYASDWSSGGQGAVMGLPIHSDGTLGTAAGPYNTGNAPMGVSTDTSGRYLYVANSNYDNNTQTNGPGSITGFSLSSTPPVQELSSSPTPTSGLYPMLLTVDPTGQYLYVAQYSSGSIEGFGINQDSGALTTPSTYTAGNNPWTVITGPAGRHLYVSNNGYGAQISIYRIQPTDGALVPATTSTLTLASGQKPLGLAIGPKGRRLYVATQEATGGGANGVVEVFTRNDPLAVGVGWDPTPVMLSTATPFTDAYGLAIAHNGRALYVVDNVPCTAVSSTSCTPQPGNIQALAIPSFNQARNAAAYTSLGLATTGSQPVQAIPGGGLG